MAIVSTLFFCSNESHQMQERIFVFFFSFSYHPQAIRLATNKAIKINLFKLNRNQAINYVTQPGETKENKKKEKVNTNFIV